MKTAATSILTCLFLFIFTATCFSQEFMIPFRDKNLWGYANLNGEIRVPARYDSVSYREDNFRWLVYKNGKTGVINEKGDEIMAPIYDTISYSPVHSRYHDFYALLNGKEGFANMDGNWIIEPFYESITRCSGRFPNKYYFFFALENGRWKLIDSSKKVYLNDIEKFRNQYDGDYAIKINGKWGLYNVPDKKTLLPFEFDSIGRLQYRDLFILKPNYKDYQWYAFKNNQITLVGKNAQTLETNYQTLDHFFENNDSNEKSYSVVESIAQPGKTFFSSLDSIPMKTGMGNPSLKISHYYSNGLREVRLNKSGNKYGLDLYFRTKTVNIPAKFDEIKLISYSKDYFNFRYLPVRLKNKWGLFDTEVKELVVPIDFTAIELSSKYDLILFSHKKSKAAFAYESNSNDVGPAIINPFEEDSLYMRMITSLRKEAEPTQYLKLYYLNIKGKLCPVGANGVHYFKD